MTGKPVIVWFQHDLRLTDNPALSAAVARGPVVPVFVWDPSRNGKWSAGAASRWWLHHSLISLDADLRKVGSQLVVMRGNTVDALRTVAREAGAADIFWNRRYEHAAIELQTQVESEMCGTSFNGSLLIEPWDVETGSGTPYQVFTPFWKRVLANMEMPKSVETLRRIPFYENMPDGLRIDDLTLLPKTDWAAGLREAWQPGEAGADMLLNRFISEALSEYATGRDRPDRDLVSRLSPHLHFGEIGPRQIWRAVRSSGSAASGEPFLRQLGWREFAHHLLYHFPHTTDHPLRDNFRAFPWRDDPEGLAAWQKGLTGYPIVDAGMRQLWHTGWMHNRVRMLAASFLVKDLLIPWQRGAEWFWDTLVDADLANNTLGWQWTAGSGADAAPYFRVFNPVSQGQKFDPHGAYVRRWVPELAHLPNAHIHAPWEALAELLSGCGVSLGETYPHRVVDHADARERALAAYDSVKTSRE